MMRFRLAVAALRNTIRIPEILRKPFRHRIPPTEIIDRTGDSRFAPTMARFGIRSGSGLRVVMASRLDEITYADYDRARFYPIVVDAIRQIVAPASRANIHIVCDRADLAELAQQEIVPLLAEYVRQTLKAGLEFGYHAAAVRWTARFDVRVSSGRQKGSQQGGGGKSGEEDAAAAEEEEKLWPFIWTVQRFAHFSPNDCRILIDGYTGDFAGIRQFHGFGNRGGKSNDVLRDRCLLWTHNREFDLHYGIPITKPAIPFIDLAEIEWDAIGKYGDLWAVPGVWGRYPRGWQNYPDGGRMSNQDVMQGIVEQLGGGDRVTMPSDVYEGGSEKKWDFGFFQPQSGAEPYSAIMGMIHEAIRLAIGAPEAVTAESQKVGGLGDGGTEDKQGLHLANLETYLDQILPEIDRLLDQFRIYNAGSSAPPLRAFFEPVDMNVTKTLLAAMVQILSSGQPIQDADGNMIYADWAKILQDKGVPTVTVSGKRLAQQLLDAANKQIGERYAADKGQDPEQGVGGGPGQDLVRGPRPDVELTSKSAAIALMMRAVDRTGLSPRLKERLHTSAVELWEESQHPRDADGKFATTNGAKHITKEEFKQEAKKVQQAGWTRGRLPNVVEHGGDLYEPKLNKETGQVMLRPVGPHEIMPAIATKMRDRGHEAYGNMIARHTGEEPTTDPATNFGREYGARYDEEAEELWRQEKGISGLAHVAVQVNDGTPASDMIAEGFRPLNGNLWTAENETWAHNAIIKNGWTVDPQASKVYSAYEAGTHVFPDVSRTNPRDWHQMPEEKYPSQSYADAKGGNGAQGQAQTVTPPEPAGKTYGNVESDGSIYKGMSSEGFPFYEDRVHPSTIGVFPGMQYKRSEVSDDENQVSDALKHVERYDQATAGPLTLWQTEDGKNWVMNGHHRRELAVRTGEESVPVRIFKEADGIDFQTARALGALQNVRDGKGTALDAAHVLKDLGWSTSELQAAGVNLRSGVGRDAISLMNLDPEALQMVKDGLTTQNVAAGIGDMGLDPQRQRLAIQKAAAAELETRSQGEILGRRMRDSQLAVKDDGSGNLFGEALVDVAWGEQAKIEDAVLRRLAKDERLYKQLTQGRAVGGTTVDQGAQRTAAQAEALARQAVATTPEIQRAIEAEALEYAADPTRTRFNRAMDRVLDVARREGTRRQEQFGGNKS